MAAHGEYKHPGGKLVVVDLEVVDLSGDFFLEPAEALDSMMAALDGAPSDLSEPDLAARVEAALPEGAVLLGFDAASVAKAVRRAVDDGRPRERL